LTLIQTLTPAGRGPGPPRAPRHLAWRAHPNPLAEARHCVEP
jgi:hypothetical protein